MPVNVDSLFQILGWKDLKSQRQIQNALMIFKTLNGLVPEYLTSKFIKRNESNYSLRDSVNKLVFPFPRKVVLVTAAQPFVTAFHVWFIKFKSLLYQPRNPLTERVTAQKQRY